MNRPSGRRSGSTQGSRPAGRRSDDRNDSRQSSRPSYSRSRDNDVRGSDNRGGNRFESGNSSRPAGGGFSRDRFVNRGDGDDRRSFRGGDRDERGGNRGGFSGRDDRRGGDDRGPRSYGDRPQGNRFGGDRDRNQGGERRSFGDRPQGESRGGFQRGDRQERGEGGPRGDRNQRASDRYPDKNRNRFSTREGSSFSPRRDDRDNRGDYRGGSDRPNRPYGDRGAGGFNREERPNRGGFGNDRGDRRDDFRVERGGRDLNRDERPNRDERGGNRGGFGGRDERRGDDRRFESRPYDARKKERPSRDERPGRFGRQDDDSGLSPNRDTYTGGGKDSFAENATKRTYSRMRQNEERMKRNGEEMPKEGELPETLEEQEMRLNRYIAASGLCSRREADNLISQGSITVNGKTVTEMGYRVEPGDKVEYGGKLLRPEKFVYVLMNKPKDFITTKEDEEGRRTVMDLLEGKVRERIYPVGRLDRNTTGLLLFTNDGEMAERLMHPSFEIKKIYQADLDKPLSPQDFEAIKKGLVLEDGPARVDDLAVLSPDRKSVGLEIHIGRNRIVRRIFEHLGYNVLRLDRVMYGGLTKKDLPRGKWRFLTPQEIMNLKYYA